MDSGADVGDRQCPQNWNACVQRGLNVRACDDRTRYTRTGLTDSVSNGCIYVREGDDNMDTLCWRKTRHRRESLCRSRTSQRTSTWKRRSIPVIPHFSVFLALTVLSASLSVAEEAIHPDDTRDRRKIVCGGFGGLWPRCLVFSAAEQRI